MFLIHADVFSLRPVVLKCAVGLPRGFLLSMGRSHHRGGGVTTHACQGGAGTIDYSGPCFYDGPISNHLYSWGRQIDVGW